MDPNDRLHLIGLLNRMLAQNEAMLLAAATQRDALRDAYSGLGLEIPRSRVVVDFKTVELPLPTERDRQEMKKAFRVVRPEEL